MISIHASRGGSDVDVLHGVPIDPNFNPRFPRGKRQPNRFGRQALTYISIHASRGGSDYYEGLDWQKLEFQSTLPAGEATCCNHALNGGVEISIHASRGGSDPKTT